jgi:hypothetical protein
MHKFNLQQIKSAAVAAMMSEVSRTAFMWFEKLPVAIEVPSRGALPAMRITIEVIEEEELPEVKDD